VARNRMIKPEFWSSEDILELPLDARLLYIGLWSFADDSGILPYKPITIKCQVFPADMIDCKPMLEELLKSGLLVKYSVDGSEYIQIESWLKHQTIRHPSYRYPLIDGTTPVYDRYANRTSTDDVPYNDSTGTDILPQKEKEKEKEKEKVNKNTLVNPTDKPSKKEILESHKRGFEQWWDLYNLKTGKKDSEKAWLRLKVADMKKCIEVAPTLKEDFKLKPLKYLKGEYFNDDPSSIGRHEIQKPKVKKEVNWGIG